MAIIIPIGVDTSGLRKLNQAGGKLRSFGKVAAIAAGAAGIGAMVKTLQIGTAEFMEQQKVAAQTGAVLKSTGGIANVTAKQIGSLSTALMKKSGVDDEAIASGQNLLLTFTKIRNETGKGNDIFNQATVAMLDLSVAMGKDMNSSAILVGKALNDPVKGASALSRAGVQLTQGQKDQIEAFVESGRVLEAQKIILQELTTQFGGSAEAAGKTLPGQLNILKQTFNNLAGEIAAKFLPGIATAATKLVGFLNQFGKQPTLEAKVRFVIDKFGDLIWSGAQTIANWWNKPKVQFEDNPANRLKVTIAPPGRDQANAFARDLVRKLNDAIDQFGFALGYNLTGFIFSGARRGSADQGSKLANDIVKNIIINKPGLDAGKRLALAIVDGVRTLFSEIPVSRLVDEWARSTLDIAGGIGFKLGKEVAKQFLDGTEDSPQVKRGPMRRMRNTLAKLLTDTGRAAVQDARRNLASLGEGIGGTLATILGATFTRPGGLSPTAITAEERAIQDKRFELEEARLVEAANATDATEEDKLALREFYLDKEKTLRDRALEDEIKNRQKGIADLIEGFNQGLISAEKFETDLRALIGADTGKELGIGFSNAFERELATVISTAAGLFNLVGTGQPLVAAPGFNLADQAQRYQIALNSWIDRRRERKDRAEAFRKQADSDGGATITAAERREINEIMREWDSQNPRPEKSAYGLALGGILKQPTFVAGEAGKEAVIPLESGSAMRILRDAIGGGGGSTQVINLTVNAGLGTNPDELSQVIVNSIKRYEKRNGAVFQGPLVTTAANATGLTDSASGATTFNRIRTLRSG